MTCLTADCDRTPIYDGWCVSCWNSYHAGREEVRDAVNYVLTEVTLRKEPLGGDAKMMRCVEVLGEDLFTKVWGYASAVSGRGERQAQEQRDRRYTVPTLDSEERW